MKKNYTIFFYIIIIFCTASCEKFLDKPPLDAIRSDDYWKTSNDLEKYIIHFYPRLGGGHTMAMEDAPSDNLVIATPNEVLNGEQTVTTGAWTNEWSDIRSINIFFDNYKKVTSPPDSYKQSLGEAHFFKAWFYFEKVRKYGDVPWYNSSLQPGSEELLKPRNPRTEVVDSILAHLDKAVSFLNLRSVAGNWRLNKEAALAFITRVALFEGTWQKYHKNTPFATAGAQPEKYFKKCTDAAEELMKNTYTKGLYSTGNTQLDYYTLFGIDNMNNVNEVLFYKAANSAENMGNNVQLYTTVRTQSMGVTWELVSSYLNKDGSIYNFPAVATTFKGNSFLKKIAQDCDPRLHATIWTPGDLRVAANASVFDKPFINQGGENFNATGFQVKKFSNPYSKAAGGDQSGGFSETGYIYFRYGEVLMNYAEAKYELDNTVAYDVLNLLRKRVGMPDFVIHNQQADPSYTDYGYTISNALYEIRRERRVELALEGRRPDDYRRWAAHKLFQGKRFLGYPFLKSEFPTYSPPLTTDGRIDYFKNLLPSGYRFRAGQDYLDDIPQVERNLNPNLTQNPGWQ